MLGTRLLLLLSGLMLSGASLAQENCTVPGAVDSARSKYLRELPSPEGVSEFSWKIVEELPNTIGPTTPENAVRYGKALNIFSDVLAEWNTSLTVDEARHAITTEVITEKSVAAGFVVPMVELVLFAKKLHDPEHFGRIGAALNPAIAELNPKLGEQLCKEMGFPIDLPSEGTALASDWSNFSADVASQLDFLKGGDFAPSAGAGQGLTGLNAAMFGGGVLSPKGAELPEIPNPVLDRTSSAELRATCAASCNWKSVATALDVFAIGAEAGPWGLGLAAAVVAVDNVSCKTVDCPKAIQDATERELATLEENKKKAAEEKEKAEGNNPGTTCDPNVASCPEQEQEKKPATEQCNPNDADCNQDTPPASTNNDANAVGDGPQMPAGEAPDSECFKNPKSIACVCEKTGQYCPEPLDPNDPRCQLEQPDLGCQMSGKELSRFLKVTLGTPIPLAPAPGEPRGPPTNDMSVSGSGTGTLLENLARQIELTGDAPDLSSEAKANLITWLDSSDAQSLRPETLDHLRRLTQ